MMRKVIDLENMLDLMKINRKTEDFYIAFGLTSDGMDKHNKSLFDLIINRYKNDNEYFNKVEFYIEVFEYLVNNEMSESEILNALLFISESLNGTLSNLEKFSQILE